MPILQWLLSIGLFHVLSVRGSEFGAKKLVTLYRATYSLAMLYYKKGLEETKAGSGAAHIFFAECLQYYPHFLPAAESLQERQSETEDFPAFAIDKATYVQFGLSYGKALLAYYRGDYVGALAEASGDIMNDFVPGKLLLEEIKFILKNSQGDRELADEMKIERKNFIQSLAFVPDYEEVPGIPRINTSPHLLPSDLPFKRDPGSERTLGEDGEHVSLWAIAIPFVGVLALSTAIYLLLPVVFERLYERAILPGRVPLSVLNNNVVTAGMFAEAEENHEDS